MHWHIGRKTFATECIRKGGDVAVLQKIMNHSKIETTMEYVKIHEDLKMEEIEKMNQVDELEGKKISYNKVG